MERSKSMGFSFPASYLIEKEFLVMTLLLSKQRNRLSISKRGDLRLYLTEMSLNIKKLVEDRQAHPSHRRNTIYYDLCTCLSICNKFVYDFTSFCIAGKRGAMMICRVL